ncbi:hypothetical protein B14911_11577 [Bacillus sp. NRRL B-14911]|nr:hypothetical protein B14911_11577 [Bacillus sp. NRRL B-14911]
MIFFTNFFIAGYLLGLFPFLFPFSAGDKPAEGKRESALKGENLF